MLLRSWDILNLVCELFRTWLVPFTVLSSGSPFLTVFPTQRSGILAQRCLYLILLHLAAIGKRSESVGSSLISIPVHIGYVQ